MKKFIAAIIGVYENLKLIISKFSTNPDSLKSKVLSGGFWAFSLRIIDRSSLLVRTIILARLLSPEDFGLFGIALLTLSSLRSFSNTGFDQALIQRKDNTEPYLNSAWVIQILRGVVLGLILVALAPLVGSFFSEPRVVPLVRVLGVAALIGGFKNIGVVYLKKELDFYKFFLYRLSGTLTDLTIALIIGFIYRSVWALVLGIVARNIVWSIVSYIIHDYRPNFKLNWEVTKELFTFGQWILSSSILYFLLNEGDDIFLGKLLGATALGLYQMAYRISNIPATEITITIERVAFPAYSKLQDNLEKLSNLYLLIVQTLSIVAFPLTGYVVLFAKDFTKLFLGQDWLPMVTSMQILCIYGLFRTFGGITGSVFRAIGKPNILTKIIFFNLISVAAIIYPLSIIWGIEGVAAAIVLGSLLARSMQVFIANKQINVSNSSFIINILPPFLSSGIFISLGYLTKVFIHIDRYYELFGLGLITLIVYLILLIFISNSVGVDLNRIIQRFVE